MRVASQEPTAAGLRERLLAFLLDYVPVLAYLLVLVTAGVVLRRAQPAALRAIFGGPWAGEASGFVLVTLPVSFYFALQEASPHQATLGKRRLHLYVVDAEGNRLTLPRSLLRTVLKFVPWELAHLCVWQVSYAARSSSAVYSAGFVLVWLLVAVNALSVVLDPRRRALYDRVAGTAVLRSPQWAASSGRETG